MAFSSLSRGFLSIFVQRNIPKFRLHNSALCCNKDGSNSSELTVRSTVFNVDGEKNKDAFLEAIKMYSTRPGSKRGQVEFIYAALKYMEEFGVHRELEAYKKILDTLPKGQYIPTNLWQAEFFHYPKQQNCIVDLLEQMEDNGVMPDAETEVMIRNIFGRHALPMKKCMRMSYWMPKFKHQSPWALPEKIPNAPLEVAKLAVQRMCSVDQASEIDIFETKELTDSLEDTWIVSGQSPTQRQLLSKLKEKQTVYVEGAFTIWLRKTSISYFILRVDPVPLTEEEKKRLTEFDYDDVGDLRSFILGDEKLTSKDIIIQPSVHEQEDGTILAVACTGSSSPDSLLSWIRFLEKKNPHLAKLSVLFATYSPIGQVVPVIESNTSSQDQAKITDS